MSETDDQGVERLKLTGQIYRWFGPPELGGEKRTGWTKFSEWSKHWEFGTEEITYDKSDSFSDVGENRVYFASKILTPCRMH